MPRTGGGHQHGAQRRDLARQPNQTSIKKSASALFDPAIGRFYPGSEAVAKAGAGIFLGNQFNLVTVRIFDEGDHGGAALDRARLW